MISRRGFISALAATMIVDPERLLWVPGQKTIFIPPERLVYPVPPKFYEVHINFDIRELAELAAREFGQALNEQLSALRMATVTAGAPIRKGQLVMWGGTQ